MHKNMVGKYSINNLKEVHGEDIDISNTNRTENSHKVIELHEHITSPHHEENSLIMQNISNNKPQTIAPLCWEDIWKAMIVEFIACILFMFIENWCAGNLIGVVTGLFTIVTIIYPVSGCNVNAVMSLSLWYYEEEFNKYHIVRRWAYILFIQPLGMFAGQMICWAILSPDIAYIKLKDAPPFRLFFTEFLYTFTIIFAALHCIVSKYTRPSQILAINLMMFFGMVYFLAAASGPISGGVTNPTKYVVWQAIAYYRDIEPKAFKNWYCYIFGDFGGAVTATLVFKYLFEPTYLRMFTLKLKWEDKFFPEKYL